MLTCPNLDCSKPNTNNSNFCISCGTQFLLNHRYGLIHDLGSGGFGRTYLAEDQKRNQAKVAVKQFFPERSIQDHPSAYQEALRLFKEESERLLQLEQHPQIPILFEFFQESESHFLVQQFIDGYTLATELEHQRKPFTEAQLRQFLLDFLPVIDFIHTQQIIHRDIKPDNILRRFSDQRLVLVDFGASKSISQTTLARTGTKIYSLGYTAPEQEAGHAHFSSDIYSLGATCLYLLTQKNPIDLWDYVEDKWTWQATLSAINNPISSSLSDILHKMLAKGIKKRYQSAAEIILILLEKEQFTPISSATAVSKLASEEDELKSAKGINYTQLRSLIKAGNWQQADLVTSQLMKQVLGNQPIHQFPSRDLHTINNLWTKYSKERFGFSIQKELYVQCGGKLNRTTKNDLKTWSKFCKLVGWRENDLFGWRKLGSSVLDLLEEESKTPSSYDKGYFPYDFFVDSYGLQGVLVAMYFMGTSDAERYSYYKYGKFCSILERLKFCESTI